MAAEDSRGAAGKKGGEAPEVPDASWQADPFRRGDRRYWDGTNWTARVEADGEGGIDPPGIDPAPAGAALNEPAAPITDAHLPLDMRTSKVPIALALAFAVMLGIVVLIGYGTYQLLAG